MHMCTIATNFEQANFEQTTHTYHLHAQQTTHQIACVVAGSTSIAQVPAMAHIYFG